MMTPQGLLKIMDTQLSNKIHPYYELLNGVPTKTGTYLAPELLKVLILVCRRLGARIQISIKHPKPISLL